MKRGLACFLAGVALFSLDALLFRTRLYPSLLEPDSSAGLFELILWREQQAQSRYGDNVVATLGDSTFAYYPRVANERTGETGYMFRSAGVAGSDPRLWYYMLRDLDPAARRYRAIVFGVRDYDDEDGPYDIANEMADLHYAIARLRLSDVVEFARSFHDRSLAFQALRGGLLKGIVYQSDILAFLAHPLQRIAYVELCHRGYEGWTYDYVETSRSMAGLRIDWAARKATFPPEASEHQRDTTNRYLLYEPAPQTGTHAAFRRAWFGRIIARYRGSRTRIVFLRLPRGPIPRPGNLVEKRSSSIREFASRPGVVLCDEHAFDALEHPELFQDAIHLNHQGCTRFSAMLAAEIARMLGPPNREPAVK